MSDAELKKTIQKRYDFVLLFDVQDGNPCYRSRWLMARALAFSMALTGSSGRRAFS